MSSVFIEQRTVSRKTPLDGMLEISAQAAAHLASLGDSFELRTSGGNGRGRIHAMSCTCTKAAGSGRHQHHFIESELLRALQPSTEVRVELDDSHPGSVSIEPA